MKIGYKLQTGQGDQPCWFFQLTNANPYEVGRINYMIANFICKFIYQSKS